MASPPSKFRAAGRILLPAGCLIVALLFLSVVVGGIRGGAGGDPVLAGRTFFAVCLKVCDRPEQADREAAAVRNRNGAGFVWQDKGYRVLAAVYLTRQEQQRVIARLTSAGESATAYDVVLPAVTVRTELSADLLEQAVSLFFDRAEAVVRLSLEPDRGRDEEEIRAELSALASHALPALGSDAVSIRLRAEYRTLQFNLEMTAAQSPLSSAVKHLSLQLLRDLQTFLTDIGET